jgi:hypothetical protein
MERKMKLFLFLVIVIYSFTAYAQLKQNSLLIGGGFSASSGTDKLSGESFINEPETDQFSISFYPQIGYFVINNFAAGLRGRIGYYHSTFNNNLEGEPETNSSSTNYEIGPFVRYYFPFSAFAVFGELNYLFGKTLGTYEQVDYSDPLQYELVERETNSTNSLFAPILGIVFFVNEAIGIEGALRYETGSRKSIYEGFENETDYEYEQDFNGFSFIIGLQIHLVLN